MLFDELPEMSEGGFTFYRSQAKQEELDHHSEPRYFLGTQVNPELSLKEDKTTVSSKYTHPYPLSDLSIGNIVTVGQPESPINVPLNRDKSSEGSLMYILTSPYKVNTHKTQKCKLIPLDENAEEIWLYENNEDENSDTTLLTSNFRASPVTVNAVCDMMVAKIYGFSELLLKDRI